MSAKEYQEMIRKAQKKEKGPKYHNKYVYVYEDGLISGCKTLKKHGSIIRTYQSKKECNRHYTLMMLERGGRISNLRWQVPMLLQEGFVDSEGKKVQPIYYDADFTYTENGRDIVEDVKGTDKRTGKPRTTEAFRLKWKLLKGRYPDKTFRIY